MADYIHKSNAQKLGQKEDVLNLEICSRNVYHIGTVCILILIFYNIRI